MGLEIENTDMFLDGDDAYEMSSSWLDFLLSLGFLNYVPELISVFHFLLILFFDNDLNAILTT